MLRTLLLFGLVLDLLALLLLPGAFLFQALTAFLVLRALLFEPLAGLGFALSFQLLAALLLGLTLLFELLTLLLVGYSALFLLFARVLCSWCRCLCKSRHVQSHGDETAHSQSGPFTHTFSPWKNLISQSSR